jgi:hypothetical protein
MRLLLFVLILTSFATVWAAYGTSELVAFSTGVIVAVLAALIASSTNGEEGNEHDDHERNR